MNGITKRLAMAGLLIAVSCSGSNGILTLGQTYTLQGIVADAVSGARLGGDLKLFLVQGPEIRGPSRMITGTGDPLMGEYAFTGIPANLDRTNSVWKVVAIRTGYQRFESEISFTFSTVDENVTDVIVNQAYSKIGNIYLFPIGVPAPDYAFTVTYQGKPVPTATVQLDPITASNSTTFVQTTGNALPNNTGYAQALTQATDATGKATFAGTTLAIGAAYKITVLPVAFKDTSGATTQLARFTGATIVAGIDNVFQLIPMADLSVSTNVFFATSASNLLTNGSPSNQVTPNGALVINFSSPVSISPGANGFSVTLNAGTTNAGGPGAAVLASANVPGVLSNGGTTLTLTPTFTTPPAATDHGATVTFGNGTALIVPTDFPAQGFTLFGGGNPVRLACGPAGAGVCAADGTTNITGTVNLTGP